MTPTNESAADTTEAASHVVWYEHLSCRIVDLRLYLRDSGFVDQRADGNAFLEAASRLHLGDALLQGAYKVVN